MQTTTMVRVGFDDVGDGEPALVLLPGWCSNRTVFRDLLRPAAASRRVLAVDWRGHGSSDDPDGDYTTDDLVEDALAVIDRAEIERFVPVGLSHAGWVAIELRRRLGPERVPGLVLLEWMVLGPPPPFLGALEGLQDPQRWEDVRASLFERWSTGANLPLLDQQLAEMGEYGFDSWSRAGREIAGQFARAGTPAAALEQLEPACPTLHLYAQPGDPEVLTAQQSYAADHPWFEVERLDAVSHFPMFEAADEMAASIEGFVRRLDRRPS